jgi:hypothetical protein
MGEKSPIVQDKYPDSTFQGKLARQAKLDRSMILNPPPLLLLQ